MNWFTVKKYLQYQCRAVNAYQIHSPFVYEFYTQVIKDRTKYPIYNAVNAIKRKLRQQHERITITDCGSGTYQNSRKLSSIVKKSAQWRPYAELLHKIMKHYNYPEFIELGTSLGFSTVYLATGNPEIQGYTIDACESSLKVAQENFQALNIHNVNIIHGKFETHLDNLLEKMSTSTLIYIDGNHTYTSTMEYFNAILKYKDKLPVLILDDLYYSLEMEKAWQEISNHVSVTLSLDLFKYGIVYFDTRFSKQNFVLKC
jgi:predicted O-methyltransferase YrrM